MQNAELFRRGIVLPLDEHVERKLRHEDCDVGMHLEYLSIESGSLFEEIWDTGVFNSINKQCDALIDDYEEEFIEPSEMHLLISVVQQMIAADDQMTIGVRRFLANLEALAQKALILNRPLLFVL